MVKIQHTRCKRKVQNTFLLKVNTGSLFHSELIHSELIAKENASIVKQSLKPEKQINTQKQTKVDIPLLNFNISLLH